MVNTVCALLYLQANIQPGRVALVARPERSNIIMKINLFEIEQEIISSYDHAIPLYGWKSSELAPLVEIGYSLRFRDNDNEYPIQIFEPNYIRPAYGIHTIGRPWYAS